MQPTPVQQTTAASAATCLDCFFRRAELCALKGNTVCPTFRPVAEAQVEPEPPRRLRAVFA